MIVKINKLIKGKKSTNQAIAPKYKIGLSHQKWLSKVKVEYFAFNHENV